MNIDISITNTLIEEWESILQQNYSSYISLYTGPSENITSVNYNIIEQETIIKDSNRTRSKECNNPEFKGSLEKFLCFYCKSYQIHYKQGLNEVAGPFVFLHYILNISYDRIFNLFQGFIDCLLNNFYYQKEIYSLQISVKLTQLLFKYHEPELYLLFNNNGIIPHFYSMSWLITVFATKMSLKLIYSFWDLLIREQDPLFTFYLVVSLLKQHKDLFLALKPSHICKQLNDIEIDSMKEINLLFNEAKTIQMNTPNSFCYFARRIQLFDPDCREDQMQMYYSVLNIESMVCLPIFPCELMKIAFSKRFNCFNDTCSNYTNNSLITESSLHSSSSVLSPLTSSINNNDCSCYIQSPNDYDKYILIDLRINKSSYIGNCKLSSIPNSFSYEQSEYVDKHLDLLNYLITIKDQNSHYVFITNSTDYFYDYEAKFYSISEEETNNELNKTIEREKIHRKVNNSFSKDPKNLHSNIKKFIEYDTLKSIITIFISNHIPHLSFLIGGFEEIHYSAIKYNIPLVNHEKALCLYCLNKKYQSYIDNIFNGKNQDFTVNINYTLGTFTSVLAAYKGRSYQGFHCHTLSFNSIKKSNPSYLIIEEDDLNLFEMIKNVPKKSFAKRKKEKIVCVATINLLDIIFIQRKPSNNRVVQIAYDNKQVIMIDLLSDVNSINFLNTIKLYIQNNINRNNNNKSLSKTSPEYLFTLKRRKINMSSFNTSI